jgi:hypothetical protein
MKEPSPSARRLFELARGQDQPDELARNRVARALSVKIAAGASLTAAGASAAPAAAWVSIVTKSALVLGVSGALVAGGYLTLRSLAPAPSAPAAAPSPARLSEKPAPAVQVEEAPPPVPTESAMAKEPGKAPVTKRLARHASPSETIVHSATVETEDGLRVETEALRQAQQALHDKEPARALQLLDEQDLRFRDGQLPQERTAARILALCQAGRVESAREQARRFESRWPRSALLGRVRAACWTP